MFLLDCELLEKHSPNNNVLGGRAIRQSERSIARRKKKKSGDVNDSRVFGDMPYLISLL